MDLKDLTPTGIAAIASALSATLLGLGRIVYVRLIKRDEHTQKRLTDAQEHDQDVELSDRAEMLKALREQIRRLERTLEAQDKRIQSLEAIIEKNNSERVQHLTTIARLEIKAEGLERENRDLKRLVGLYEGSEPS